MLNMYGTAGVFPLFFGFEYRSGEQVHLYPFPLAADQQHSAAVMVPEHFGQLIEAGLRCWGLGLMVDRSSSVEKQDNGQYRLTFADVGDPVFTGLVVDMDGNGYHAVVPRGSTSHIRVHHMPASGHRRTVLSDDPTVMALESSARALPQLWRTDDTARARRN